VERLGYELGNEIIKNNRLKNEKRESILKMEKYKNQVDELKSFLQKDNFMNEITTIAEDSNNLKYQNANMSMDNNELKQLQTYCMELENDKIDYVRKTSFVIEEYRNYIKFFNRRFL